MPTKAKKQNLTYQTDFPYFSQNVNYISDASFWSRLFRQNNNIWLRIGSRILCSNVISFIRSIYDLDYDQKN